MNDDDFKWGSRGAAIAVFLILLAVVAYGVVGAYLDIY